MIAKHRLIDFLKNAPHSKNGIYEFRIWCLSESEIQKYVHRMRVELSRLREELREQGKQLRFFKMVVISRAYDKEKKQATIVMRFKDSLNKDFSAALDDVFDIISQGTDVLNEKEVRGLPKKPKNHPKTTAIGNMKIHVK